MITPIQVLFVDHESQLGGAELSMVDIVKHTTKANVEYSCVVSDKGPLSDALVIAGAKSISYLPMESWRWWGLGFKNRLKLIASFPNQIINIVRWYKFIKGKKPQIIHFNLTHFVEPIIAAKMAGIPIVIHFRENAGNNLSFFGGFPLLFKLLNLADVWVANSNTTYAHIAQYAKKGTLVKIIPNGVDIDRFQNADRSLSENHDHFIVAKLASLVPWKNHKLFLQIAKLSLEGDDNIRFKICGFGSPDYEKELRNMADTLEIAHRVEFLGFVNDIGGLYQDIDLLLHTSGSETFGRVYAEAMAAGKPIIAIKGEVEKEVIGEGEGGFLYSTDQITELVQKINELARNPVLCHELGQKGLNRVTRSYSIESLTQSIHELYSEILTFKKFRQISAV
jgi:glycosyltransferase involved in cell wall biosynthesis